MKTIVKVTDITHEDLVDLLSTALYGSSWLGCDYRVDDNMQVVKFKESDTCFEDYAARCLLQGKKIEFLDRFSEDKEDDYDSNIEHYWDDGEGCMCYKVSLKDIEKTLSEMLSKGGWPSSCVMSLINSDQGNFDQPQADCIIQHLLWGEEIYG